MKNPFARNDRRLAETSGKQPGLKDRPPRGRRVRRDSLGRSAQRRRLGPVEPMGIIDEARTRANLTIYGLAKLADIDQTYLRRLVNGQRRSPSRDALVSLGEALMHFDERFKRKDLDQVLKTAGLLKLPKGWQARQPRNSYNPRSRIA